MVGGWGRLIQNAYSCEQKQGDVTPYVYVRFYTTLFMFLAAFLSYSVLYYLQKSNLTFTQKKCVRQKRLFFSNEINFCRHEISLFTLNYFCEPKLAKTPLILIKQKLRYTLCFNMITYFDKTLCNVAQEIRYILFSLFYETSYLTSTFTEFA